MSIASYSDLVTAIGNWAARTDTAFTDRVPEFIALAEERIFYGSGERGDSAYSEPLRIRQMETSGDLTVDAQTVAMPTGFLEPRRLYLNTDPKVDLDYLPPDRFWAALDVASSTTGKPRVYTIEGTNFVFGPAPDSTYTAKLLYYAKFDALSDSNATNWLILNAPGVYLYASMLEAAIWDKDSAKANEYLSLYQSKVNALVNQDKRSRVQAPMRMIVDRTA